MYEQTNFMFELSMQLGKEKYAKNICQVRIFSI